jgi:hypothetical protein
MALLAWLAGCAGLKDLIPEGPVLSHPERLAAFPDERGSGARYTSPAVDGPPVPPVQVFGVSYDVDLVLRSTHPEWDMHEYARIATPDGPLWLAKDARRSTKAQSIVAAVPGLAAWLPEVPVIRKEGRLEVEDRSTAQELDLVLRYDNLDGVPVEVRYRGPQPGSFERDRNSSTMGHSAGEVAAVLDLSHKAFAKEASITIGGERQRLVHLLGIVPFRLVLAQTQAGFSVGEAVFSSDADGPLSVHAGGAAQRWWTHDSGDAVELVQDAAIRRLRYRFARADDGALELVSAHVSQYGQAAEPCHVVFRPAIPDLRRRFEGEVAGRFVVDVAGQPSHGVGAWRARWEGDSAVVELMPEAPAWFAERPMRATVTAELADAAGPAAYRLKVARAP